MTEVELQQVKEWHVYKDGNKIQNKTAANKGFTLTAVLSVDAGDNLLGESVDAGAGPASSNGNLASNRAAWVTFGRLLAAG